MGEVDTRRHSPLSVAATVTILITRSKSETPSVPLAMKAEDQYLRFVRWSDADGAYVGSARTCSLPVVFATPARRKQRAAAHGEPEPLL
jgi:hypothetical protein